MKKQETCENLYFCRRSCEIIYNGRKTPLSHKLCAFRWMLELNYTLVRNYFFLETTLLQREPFLTMLYTINSSHCDINSSNARYRVPVSHAIMSSVQYYPENIIAYAVMLPGRFCIYSRVRPDAAATCNCVPRTHLHMQLCPPP